MLAQWLAGGAQAFLQQSAAHRSRDKAVRQKHSFAATQNAIPASCNAMSEATEVLSNSIAIRGTVRRSGVMSPSLAARHRSRPMGTR